MGEHGSTLFTYYLFCAVAPLHSLVCILAFFSWTVVRVPVLIYRIERQRKIQEMGPHKKRALTDSLENLSVVTAATDALHVSLDAMIWLVGLASGSEELALRFELAQTAEFWSEVLLVVTSVVGLVYSPLYFSYHLFHVVYNEDLGIVLAR